MALVGEELARPLTEETDGNVSRDEGAESSQAVSRVRPSEDDSEASDEQAAEIVELLPNESRERTEEGTEDDEPQRAGGSPQEAVVPHPCVTPNEESFECTICLFDIPPGSGAVLRQCTHTFCRQCLASLVKHCDDTEVRCPFSSTEMACRGVLLDSEVRALVSAEVMALRDMRCLNRAGFDIATGQLWPSLTETTMRDLVTNSTRFECPLCFSAAAPGAGVVLKDCLHSFCRSCLVDVAEGCVLEEVPCPCTSSDYRCESYLLQEEVRALLGPAAYTRRMERALQHASEERAARQMWGTLQAIGQQDLAPNADPFDCPICFCTMEPGEGVVLKECLHTFCRDCLAGLVRHCDAPEVQCPFVSNEYSCTSTLTAKEIRALVSDEDYERHLARSLRQAEGNTANSFHCRTASCAGWCEFEDTVNTFCCPVCTRVNCITCRAIHEGIDCRDYQERLAADARHNEEARQTQAYLQDMLARRQAINCPVCRIVLMKKDGCDWMLCPACRNEVCWITGKARWGPRGRGDSSGGCRCRVNGKLCHPNCRNCH
ncbi:ranBP-type and C3HC4-type zinc finger-containing protein 1-like [Amphibalanus amphitrite]|uniref:ranBP-type and C3HC4-type zinc finger-containing protein 1-like n=1 Tax=Amphibalanus amphitrite TaxID=1232801 RepID=UPI001C8FCCF9|nr:ranBP-type and C3HC4-type zinc finger-containing protein 1-like [Amphibalanus amphitrite]